MKIRFVAPAVLALLTLAQPVDAELLTYTASGGLIDGSLNGVEFANATWDITVTADPSHGQFYPAGYNDSIWVDVWALPVTPTLTITAGDTILTATLPGWDIEFRDYFHAFEADNDIMFSNAFADGHDGVMQGRAVYISVTGGDTFRDLNAPASFYGNSNFDRRSYSTSAGTLVITRSESIPGSFIITAVPEPSTTAAFIGVGVLALAIARRRFRHAPIADRTL